MIKPINIHTNALNCVEVGKLTIIAAHIKMPNIGTNGTNGVLNGLGMVGLVFLSSITPIHTSTNANKVPMEVRSPAMLDGRNAENRPTKTNRIILLLYGVLNLG